MSESELKTSNDWVLLTDREPPKNCARLIVTNNINARDALGHHSHIWLVHMVHRQDNGSYAAFDDHDMRIYGLTHWRYAIPQGSGLQHETRTLRTFVDPGDPDEILLDFLNDYDQGNAKRYEFDKATVLLMLRAALRRVDGKETPASPVGDFFRKLDEDEQKAAAPQPLPDPLNDPPAARCNACGRKTWVSDTVGKPCNLPMPTGKQCFGTFEAL